MFQRSFAVAKEVRSSTEIGAHSISMAAAGGAAGVAAVRGPAPRRRVLFVGAGEMIELAATHFAARQPRQIAVANRSCERGRGAGRRASAPTAMPLADLPVAPGRVRHRRLLHRELAADHRPGRGRAGAEGAPAPADVHGRPRGAARHRARGGAPFRRLPLHRRRPVGAGADRAARSARRRSRRPRRSSRPACRASSSGSTSAARCR